MLLTAAGSAARSCQRLLEQLKASPECKTRTMADKITTLIKCIQEIVQTHCPPSTHGIIMEITALNILC